MRSEATEVKSTLAEIEDWLDKLMQLTEEVGLLNYTWYGGGILWNGTRGRDGSGKIGYIILDIKQIWQMVEVRS